MTKRTDLFDEMADRWRAPVVARELIEEFSGGLMRPKYLANLDSQKLGPPRIKLGRKVGYPTRSLIIWMRERSCV